MTLSHSLRSGMPRGLFSSFEIRKWIKSWFGSIKGNLLDLVPGYLTTKTITLQEATRNFYHLVKILFHFRYFRIKTFSKKLHLFTMYFTSTYPPSPSWHTYRLLQSFHTKDITETLEEGTVAQGCVNSHPAARGGRWEL